MKRRLQFSLGFCFVLMTIACLVSWWWTMGDPYTDFFARIVQQRLETRTNNGSLESKPMAEALMREVGVDLAKLDIKDRLEFRAVSTISLTSTTLYQLSPEYLLRIEEEQTQDGTQRVYAATVIRLHRPYDDE